MVSPKDYLNTWVLPYGQILLLKHVSIVPVLVFALINGFLSKKMRSDSSWDPKPWIRIESISLFIVFFFTGILGTLSPASHDIETTLKSEGAAPWLSYLWGQDIMAPVQVGRAPTIEGIFLIVIALLFLWMIILSFYKRVKPFLAFGFGICFLVAMYTGLMMTFSV